jgi:ABC-type transport system involved in cytochrome bd biosynthesis fused ATPase/permease subunit
MSEAVQRAKQEADELKRHADVMKALNRIDRRLQFVETLAGGIIAALFAGLVYLVATPKVGPTAGTIIAAVLFVIVSAIYRSVSPKI